MTSLFIDSDILLDAIERAPLYSCIRIAGLGGFGWSFFIDFGPQFTKCIYFASKKSGKKAESRSILLLEEKLTIRSTHGSAIKQALLSDFSDIEDAI